MAIFFRSSCSRRYFSRNGWNGYFSSSSPSSMADGVVLLLVDGFQAALHVAVDDLAVQERERAAQVDLDVLGRALEDLLVLVGAGVVVDDDAH
jgi:hypothetical protein